MTITNLSDLGGIVCVDGRADEDIISAKADGARIAGELVSIIGTAGATQGDIVGTDVGASEFFVGILLPKFNVDCDTAVLDGLLVEIVRPRSGRRYNIRVVDPAANREIGDGGIFGATVGQMDLTVVTAIGFRLCNLTKVYLTADNDAFAEVIWV